MSIRVRLLLLVLGAVLLPVILVGWRYYQDRGKDIDVAVSGLTAMARTIAANLDAKIQGTTQLHFGLSRARDLSGHDKAACSNFLSDVLDKNPQYTGILTVDPSGSLFCASLRTGRVLDLSDRNYFKRAANTSNAIVIEAAFGRLTGAPVLQIAYPVRDGSQQLEFVLLASLDLTKFMQEQTEHLLHGFEVILTDHQGTVLFRPPARLGDWRDQHCVASVGVVFELAYSRFLSSQLLIERVNRVSCSRTTKSKTIVGLIVPVICSADFPRS